jgi:hypothetical protein
MARGYWEISGCQTAEIAWKRELNIRAKGAMKAEAAKTV